MSGGIAVLGAGAFGTALAVSLAANGPVTLWARDPAHAEELARDRENMRRLPGVRLPDMITVSTHLNDAAEARTILLAVPMQALAQFLSTNARLLDGRALVSCAKGIDLRSGQGASALIRSTCPAATAALLTGPSFADDIARGLPTALTLACADPEAGATLQRTLATPALRLYRSADVAGAELGGALKNVIAIAAGIVIGCGFGESARAALMARGYAEMMRLALALGARPETLAGLSGFGDLVLTCTSEKSRNFRFGLGIGRGEGFGETGTVEGAATSHAVARIAAAEGLEMPIAATVSEILKGNLTVRDAAASLLARPLKEE